MVYLEGCPLTPDSTNVLILANVEVPPLPIYRMHELPLRPEFAFVQTKSPRVTSRGRVLTEEELLADWEEQHGPPTAEVAKSIRNVVAKSNSHLAGERKPSIEMVLIGVYAKRYPGRLVMIKLFNENLTYIQVLAVRKYDLSDARYACDIFLDACEELVGALDRTRLAPAIDLLNVTPLHIRPPEGTRLSLDGLAAALDRYKEYGLHAVRVDTINNSKGTEIQMAIRYRDRPPGNKETMSVQVYAAGSVAAKASKSLEEFNAFCEFFEGVLRAHAEDIFPSAAPARERATPAEFVHRQLVALKVARTLRDKKITSAEQFEAISKSICARILSRLTSDHVRDDQVHDDSEEEHDD